MRGARDFTTFPERTEMNTRQDEYTHVGAGPGLPDPARQPAFYAGTAVKRGLAWVADGLVIFALTLVVLPFTAFLGLFVYAALWAVVGFFYRTASISTFAGTLGMRLMSLELRDADGQRPDFGQAFLHTSGYYISVAVFPLQLISILLMMGSERGQGLTDHILGTVILNRRA